MARAVCVAGIVLCLAQAVFGQEKIDTHAQHKPIGEEPAFELKKPNPEYLKTLESARASSSDYFFRKALDTPGGLRYEVIKNYLAPIRYVNAPWRYAGVILSPKGSTQKFRVIENGFQIDAGLTRRTPPSIASVWAKGDTHLWVTVGVQDELFGQDEHRQSTPGYENGYLPIFRVEYESGGTVYEEEVLAHSLLADYRSPETDEPGIAAYVRLTAKSGPGVVGFQLECPPVGYGFPIVPGGFRRNAWTDEHNNPCGWFSEGGNFDAKKGLLRYHLKKGESAFVVLPHQLQLAGTQVTANAANYERARRAVRTTWAAELKRGGQVSVPEKVVMDAYRSLFIGDWQVSVGDELPYGMFSWYQGNGYGEILQTVAPFIEYGYFQDARRFIQPFLEYPLSDTGIGLHVVANRLELAAYYYALSKDADFIRKNKASLVEAGDYFLAHRDPATGLVMDGYAFDKPDEKVQSINTNTNGWRAVRDLGLTLQAIGDVQLGQKYLRIAREFGDKTRAAILASIDQSTQPPFVPFAIGEEKPYKSLVESRESSYYNIVMPYFFESEIFPADAAPYTDTLNYMWEHQGVMAGLNRFNGHGTTYAQDGIHPLYTWGRQFAQISRREHDRAVYTFYSSLAHGYTRGTFLTGECQSAEPSETEWYRGTYLPPEPPANALLLRSLRHMLLHENDREQDGIYDELWLLNAIPVQWLAPGKSISLDKMPTRFGPVSLRLRRSADGNTFTGSVTLASGILHKEVLLYVPAGGSRSVRASLVGGGKLSVHTGANDVAVALPAEPGVHRFVIRLGRIERWDHSGQAAISSNNP